MEVIKNTDFLITKRAIINKVMQMFEETGQLLDLQLEFPENHPLSKVKKLRHKITRGENYSELPFVALDFPGISGAESVFSFRTLFLWGRYFTFNVVVKGVLLDELKDKISGNFGKLRNSGFLICCGDDCWNNLISGPEYSDPDFLEESNFSRLLEKDFFRAGKTLPLDEWERFPEKALENYRVLLEILK